MGKKYIKRVRIDGLEPAAKFEGKWFVFLAPDDAPEATSFLCSHKQMTSVQRSMDSPCVFAAFEEVEGKKWHRFIWASSNRQWLNDFINAPQKPYTPKPKTEVTNTFADFKETTMPKQESYITEEDIPF